MAPHYLAELTSALDEIEPLAEQIAGLKKSVMEREARALEEILKRVWQLMPVLTGKLNGYYHNQIILMEHEEHVQTGPDEGFENSTKLISCEDRRLVFVHDIIYWGNKSKTCTISEEFELSYCDAIRSCGLEPIAANILKELQTAGNFTVIKGEELARLEDVSKVLEVLICTP